MTRWVELYRGLGRTFHTRLELNQTLVEAALQDMERDGRPEVPVALAMVCEPDRGRVVRDPAVVNGDADFGSVVVVARPPAGKVIRADGTVETSQIQYRRYLSELFGPYLQERLRQSDPGEQYWEFRITSDDPGELSRPAPDVDNTVEVTVGRPRARQARIRRVDGPELTTFDPAEHGMDPAGVREMNVVLTPEVYQQLAHTLPLSDTMETGGFLIGTAHTLTGRPDAHLVRITQVIPAEKTGASATQFTFTPDSFAGLNDQLDAGSDQVLLGWYHSHLFSASGKLVLSQSDVGLHFRTFQRPFQVAGLINYTFRERTVRFFARQGEQMRETPYWVEDENARYRLERAGGDPR
ncbi:JAB N-terminal domain-containing protein [Actinoplanes sp. NPDC004185]